MNLDNNKNCRVGDDVVDLVVFSDPIETILDVGEALKNTGTYRVGGLEFMPDACEEAKYLPDHVSQGSTEDISVLKKITEPTVSLSYDTASWKI